ncbi:MAG TPA: TetR/AcrR family transcriptional regulator [Acidobacteriota bacterium]|jgi:AcrR family transcriptional regulator|nr:TetR/AcrR family transcriptional regulator [Acidobacteriota bacterium]
MNRKRRLTRRESQEATRACLIEAAEQAFIRHGFDGSSVEQIAEAAGFSRGAFYSNFADKNELFLAVLDKRRLQLATTLDEIIRGIPDPGRRLEAVRDWFVNQWWRQKDWIALRIEFSRRAMRDRAVRTRLAKLRRHELETYTGLVAEYFAAAGVEPLERPETVALALLAVWQGLGSMALAGGGRSLERAYTEAAGLVFDRLAMPYGTADGGHDA